jgi:hypothetical protein
MMSFKNLGNEQENEQTTFPMPNIPRLLWVLLLLRSFFVSLDKKLLELLLNHKTPFFDLNSSRLIQRPLFL